MSELHIQSGKDLSPQIYEFTETRYVSVIINPVIDYRPTNHFRKSMLYPILQSRLHTRLLKERDLSALQSRAA